MSTKRSTKLAAILLCLFSLPVLAESKNRFSYSSLGLGFETLTYKEKRSTSVTLTNSATVVDIEENSDYSGGNLSLRSSSFVARNDNLGFYINTGSTMGSQNNEEEWTISFVNRNTGNGLRDVPVQTSATVLSKSGLEVLAVQALKGSHSALYGARYDSFDFKRYDFVPQNTDIFTRPEDEDRDTVSVESKKIIIEAGYEYNEFFITQDPGWKAQVQSVLGIALYNHVRNTGLSTDAFADTFNSYDIRVTGSYGYQFDANFLIALTLDLMYQSTKEIEETVTLIKNQTDSAESIPENDYSYLQTSVNFLWSF